MFVLLQLLLVLLLYVSGYAHSTHVSVKVQRVLRVSVIVAAKQSLTYTFVRTFRIRCFGLRMLS